MAASTHLTPAPLPRKPSILGEFINFIFSNDAFKSNPLVFLEDVEIKNNLERLLISIGEDTFFWESLAYDLLIDSNLERIKNKMRLWHVNRNCEYIEFHPIHAPTTAQFTESKTSPNLITLSTGPAVETKTIGLPTSLPSVVAAPIAPATAVTIKPKAAPILLPSALPEDKDLTTLARQLKAVLLLTDFVVVSGEDYDFYAKAVVINQGLTLFGDKSTVDLPETQLCKDPLRINSILFPRIFGKELPKIISTHVNFIEQAFNFALPDQQQKLTTLLDTLITDAQDSYLEFHVQLPTRIVMFRCHLADLPYFKPEQLNSSQSASLKHFLTNCPSEMSTRIKNLKLHGKTLGSLLSLVGSETKRPIESAPASYAPPSKTSPRIQFSTTQERSSARPSESSDTPASSSSTSDALSDRRLVPTSSSMTSPLELKSPTLNPSLIATVQDKTRYLRYDPYILVELTAKLDQDEIFTWIHLQESSVLSNGLLGLDTKDNASSLQTLFWYFSGPCLSAYLDKVHPRELSKAVCQGVLVDNHWQGGRRTSPLNLAAGVQPTYAFKKILDKLNQQDVRGKTFFIDFFAKNLGLYDRLLNCVLLYQSGENIAEFIKFTEVLFEMIRKEHYWQYVGTSYRNRKFCNAALWKVRDPAIKSKIESLATPAISFWQKTKKSGLNEEHFDVKSVERMALDTFKKGFVFIKTVRTESKNEDGIPQHQAFLESVYFPEKRAAVRKKSTKARRFETNACKFIPRPNPSLTVDEQKRQIFKGYFVKCRDYHTQAAHTAKKDKQRPGKKTPMTLVSPDLNTGIYGLEDHDRQVVGYAFTTSDLKDIKQMYWEDSNTWNRHWIGQKNSLFRYCNELQNRICLTFEEFKETIRSRPYTINEALVKVRKENLFAIVIFRDTFKARKEAVTRRILNAAQGKDLPILFHDPELRHVGVYPLDEQLSEYPELTASLQFWRALNTIEQNLREQLAIPTQSKISFLCEDTFIELDRDTVVTDLEKLKETRNACLSDPIKVCQAPHIGLGSVSIIFNSLLNSFRRSSAHSAGIGLAR